MALIEKTKTVVTTRRHLRVTGNQVSPERRSTFALDGGIVPIGAIVEVSMSEATNLIHRGVAIDATPEEVATAGENIIVSPSRNDRWEDA